MRGRLFTLREANRALPLVRAISRDVVSRYAAAKSEIREWERLRTAHGRRDADAELDRCNRRIAHELDRLRALTDELEALGCRLRDFENGVVDFPAARLGPGEFVYYCWALGEIGVSHWRGESDAFEQRRLVEAGADS